MIALRELALILTRGAPARDLLRVREALLAASGPDDGAIWPAAAIASACKELGLRAPRPIAAPTLRGAKSIQSRLGKWGVRALWADDPAYPARALSALNAPPWILTAGDAAKLAAPQIAIVGSRETSAPLLRAAERLGAAVSAAGWVVTSGLAPGADQAAHAGALSAHAAAEARAGGGLAVPARGILAAMEDSPFPRETGSGLAWLGLGRPEEPFSAGLAIRRNHAMAALADGVVLVASGPTGGSFYAVRWALAEGRPVWAFEAGSRTPAGNAALIGSGRARPLSIKARPESWVEIIVEDAASAKKKRRRPPPKQLEMLG